MSEEGKAEKFGRIALWMATVAFGLARQDLRDEFSAYLDELVAVRKAAQ